MWNRDNRRLHLIVLCTIAIAAAAMPLAQGQPPAAPAPQVDPLGRDTPFGTVTGFSTAVHRSDFVVAARYLQTTGRSERDLEALVRDLSDLLDRYFTQPITSVSRVASGDLADGLDTNRERIPLALGDRTVELFLTRVPEAGGGQVWVFSSESLARVPALSRSPQATWVERLMPAVLVSHSFAGLSIAQWIVWAASLVVPLIAFMLIGRLVGVIGRRRIADPTRRAVFQSWWNGVRWLLVLGFALAAHLAVIPQLGFSLIFRVNYARLGLTAWVVIATLLVWRLVSVTFHHAQLLALRRGRTGTQSLIQLGERIARVVLILIAIFGLLALAGVDMTTALAGVGIVGVAVALGAQKSVENLLGGIFLLSDQALAVGDYCRLSDREGWVEDVTLRSVRLRTVEQTLLSVPAGLLAQGSIENFASRKKMLVQNVLRLRYGTSAEALRTILDRIRALLATHPQLDRESARISLVAFGPNAIELELFTYVATSEFRKFIGIRESLLLEIGNIVEESGSAFASATQFVPLAEPRQGPPPEISHPDGRTDNR